MSHPRRKITFFLAEFPAGGQEQVTLTLMQGLAARGHQVELLLLHRRGDYLAHVPDNIRITELPRRSRWSGYRRFLPGWPREAGRHLAGSLGLTTRPLALHHFLGLVNYIEIHKPDVLIAAHGRVPILALWAARVARHPVTTLIVEHTILSSLSVAQDTDRARQRQTHLLQLMRRVYPTAHALAAVSQSGARDLETTLGLAPQTVHTLYNPVSLDTSPDAGSKSAGTLPRIMTAARLAPEKAQIILLEAVARLKAQGHLVELIILGEGPERTRLNQRIQELTLQDQVQMPGWQEPYPWLCQSQAFVLCSEYESLPTSLIEAMACGCPVIATDCPGGTREILQDGRHGLLVPVHDSQALATAIQQTLAKPPNSQALRQRAQDFAMARGVDRYETLIESLCDKVATGYS